MSGPTPVNGITGFIIANPEAPPFNVHGGPADPRHAGNGPASVYPWEVIPMGPFPNAMQPIDGMVGGAVERGILPAGVMAQDPTADNTPAYHAAPFPTEGPASGTADQFDITGRQIGSTRQLLESLRIHASNTGAGLKRLFLPQMLARQDDWTGFYNDVEGEDNVPSVPGSIGNNAFGVGVNDHTSNAFAKKNSYGFNTSHRHRRFATGSIPGNTQWMRPGGRPMVRSFTGNHPFPLSGPFANDDPGATFGYQGAILQNIPSEYVTPPQPSLSNSMIGIDPVGQTIPEIPLF